MSPRVWYNQEASNMLHSIVSNSHFGKRPIVEDLTTLGSHVGAHVSESVNSY